MAQIKNEAAYQAALKRIDQLLPLVNDSTPVDDPNYLELDMISDMVEEYEDIHYPIESPALADVIKLRMYEQGLTMENLSELLGLTMTNVKGLFNNKYTPSIKVGKIISQKLNIDPATVLGV